MSGSELAPLVAAALRDKVVADMQQEIDQLKEQTRSCRRVDLLVDNDIYGVGNLEDCTFSSTGNSVHIHLTTTTTEQKQTCAGLQCLFRVAVRFGGTPLIALQAEPTFHDESDSDDDDDDVVVDDNDDSASKEVCIFDSDNGFEYHVVIEGVSRRHFSAHTGEEDAGREIDMSALIQSLPPEIEANANVVFTSVAVPTDQMEGALASLPPNSWQKKLHCLICHVDQTMKDIGYYNNSSSSGDLFEQYKGEITEALASELHVTEYQPVHLKTIKDIVQMHYRNTQRSEEDKEDFSELVERYALKVYIRDQMKEKGYDLNKMKQEDVDSKVEEILRALEYVGVESIEGNVCDDDDDDDDNDEDDGHKNRSDNRSQIGMIVEMHYRASQEDTNSKKRKREPFFTMVYQYTHPYDRLKAKMMKAVKGAFNDNRLCGMEVSDVLDSIDSAVSTAKGDSILRRLDVEELGAGTANSFEDMTRIWLRSQSTGIPDILHRYKQSHGPGGGMSCKEKTEAE